MYDLIVAGLGGIGSAAAYQLAGRGKQVFGLEKHTPAYDKGSSHGRSHIIRQAYFEGRTYVPLLLRSYELLEVGEIQRRTLAPSPKPSPLRIRANRQNAPKPHPTQGEAPLQGSDNRLEVKQQPPEDPK